MPRRPYAAQHGFAYLGVLLLIIVLGLALAALSVTWHTVERRDKEKELLFIGNQYRQAIRLYYENSPGTIKQYPRRLQELLDDNRYLVRQRYLRKTYADPITGESDWGEIRAPDGGILGVYSLSEKEPLKIDGFRLVDATFAGKLRYRDWEFSYVPPAQTANVPARL